MNSLQHNNKQQCVCGKLLPFHAGKGRTRRYCSDACKQREFRNRSREKRNAKHQIVYLLNSNEQVPIVQNSSSLQLLLQSGGICQGEAYDVLKTFPHNCIDMVMTSPPYWGLRDYGVAGQLGLEPTFDEYITRLCAIFDEVKRVLKDTGTCWVNIGDSYNNSGWARGKERFDKKRYHLNRMEHGRAGQKNYPDKCLAMTPFRFAIEMVNRGWILRNTIIWQKPNILPASVKDRFTVDFEYLFFFSTSQKYYFEQQYEPLSEAYLERAKYPRPQVRKWDEDKKRNLASYLNKYDTFTINPLGRNKRTVWSIPPKPLKGAHFAVYPPELCETPIKAGCPPGGVVLDPFMGSGTTCVVAAQLGRRSIGVELNGAYVKIAQERLAQASLLDVS